VVFAVMLTANVARNDGARNRWGGAPMGLPK
jgi:hypothetical protein